MKEASWRRQYPFESNWRRLTPDGPRYHYLDEGDGLPLLMVHGNPTWSFYYRRLVQEFSNRYRVIVPDHLGCGLSDKPQHGTYTLQAHIDRLVDLIDDLDLRDITVFGHDWGGAIGLGAALARPDRVSRFVLFNTGAFPPPFIPWRIRACRIPILGKIAVQGFNLFSRAALQMAVQNRSSLDRETKAGLLAPYDCWRHRIAVYRFVQDIPAATNHPTWDALVNIETNLNRFADLPCQLIWGMRDWCFRPSCLEKLIALFPNCTVKRIPDAGHWVVEEAHEEIVDCLEEFLSIQVPAR